MNFEDKRSLDELIMMYESEPELQDIYVEGASDKRFFEGFLQAVGLDNVSVYEISDFNIPNDIVQTYGQPDGNKGRVITLAFRLNDSGMISISQVACITDADFDRILGVAHSLPHLLYTDYTDLEMYAFDEATLQKFLHRIIPEMQRLPAEVILHSGEVLRVLFWVRLLNEKATASIENAQWERCCKHTKDSFSFDEAEYIKRVVLKNNLHKEKDRLYGEYISYKEIYQGDIRHFANGHDVAEFLDWYIHGYLGKRVFDKPHYLERTLLALVDYSKLADEERLFREILKRFKSG